jgi:hypothetical protein
MTVFVHVAHLVGVQLGDRVDEVAAGREQVALRDEDPAHRGELAPQREDLPAVFAGGTLGNRLLQAVDRVVVPVERVQEATIGQVSAAGAEDRRPLLVASKLGAGRPGRSGASEICSGRQAALAPSTASGNVSPRRSRSIPRAGCR